MKIDVEQNTDEWIKQRLGKFTASSWHKLMAEPKTKAEKEAGELSKGAKTYCLEKVAEILSGEPASSFSGESTNWGHETEDKARFFYEGTTGLTVDEGGFFEIDDNSGASPDGIVYDEETLLDAEPVIKIVTEYKCPDSATHHLKYFLLDFDGEDEYGARILKDPAQFKKIAGADYWYQVQCNLIATKAPTAHFVSFRPDMPLNAQAIIIRIDADTDLHAKMLERKDKAVEYRNELHQRIFDA